MTKINLINYYQVLKTAPNVIKWQRIYKLIIQYLALPTINLELICINNFLSR